MMKLRTGVLAVGLMVLMRVAGGPAEADDVFWLPDASGDWDTAGSWSKNPPDLPGPNDNVTIGDKPSAVTVTIDQVVPGIRSLFCDESLTITGGYPIDGSGLTIGAGGGEINGTLSLQMYRHLVVDGGLFNVNGPTDIGFAHFTATNNGRLNLPTFTTSTGGVNLTATSGGRIDASALTSLSSYFQSIASGANSEINITGMTTLDGELEATDGGTIRIANGLTTLSDVIISIGNGGSFLNADGVDALSIATSMSKMRVIVDNSAPNFDSVASFSDSWGTVYGGGQLRLPALTTITPSSPSSISSSFGADGNGSLVDLNSVLTIDDSDTSWSLSLEASDGGRIQIQNATVSPSAAGGRIIADARGSNSVVDMRSLKNLTATGMGSRMELSAIGGKIIISDQVTAITEGAIEIGPGGTIEDSQGNNALEQLTAVTDSGIYLYGAAPGLNGVTDVSGSWFEMRNGSTFTLAPLAAACKIGGDFDDWIFWDAHDAGTVLDLSTLPGIQSSGFELLDLHAANGGQINASNVTQIPDGGDFTMCSEGANSVINVANLSYLGDGLRDVSVHDGGKIIIDQTSMDSVYLTVGAGGKLERSNQSDVLSQLTGFTNGALDLFGEQSVTLTNCTDVGGSDFYVGDGANLTLGPSVTDYAMGGGPCTCTSWYADNWDDVVGGGVLDFSSLQTISATQPWELDITLYDGGKLDLSSIKLLPADGYVTADVSGTGALLDLPRRDPGDLEIGLLRHLGGDGVRDSRLDGLQQGAFRNLRRTAGRSGGVDGRR